MGKYADLKRASAFADKALEDGIKGMTFKKAENAHYALCEYCAQVRNLRNEFEKICETNGIIDVRVCEENAAEHDRRDVEFYEICIQTAKDVMSGHN